MSIEERKAKIQEEIEKSKLSEKGKIELLAILELIIKDPQFRLEISSTDRRVAERIAIIDFDKNPRLGLIKKFIGDETTGESEEAIQEMSLEDLDRYIQGKVSTAELYMYIRSIMNIKAAGFIKKQIEESSLDDQKKSDLLAALEEASKDPLGRINVGLSNNNEVKNRLQIVVGDDVFGETSRKSRLGIVHRFIDPSNGVSQEVLEDNVPLEELASFVSQKNERTIDDEVRE